MVIPYFDFEFNIPLNAEIDSVNVVFGNPTDLGQLNIPSLLPAIGTYPVYGYVTCPDDLGVYPPRQYSHKAYYFTDYNLVSVKVYPLLFDTATKQTTLYEAADIEVRYRSPGKGLILKFFPDKPDYMTDENIETTTIVENVSSDSNPFFVSVNLFDRDGNLLRSNRS